jgi:drug/metabolite transporter, DME family
VSSTVADLRARGAASLSGSFGPSIIIVVASVVWSFGSLNNRWANGVDAWQYLFWRSIGVVVVLEVLARVRRQSSPLVAAWTTGPAMFGASIGLLGASMGYVYAVKNTTAANAAFFSSLTPFVAAFLAFMVFRDRFRRGTWFAMALAGLGLSLVVFGPDAGAVQGEGVAATMRGNLAALACSFGFALYMICVRTDHSRSWAPAMPGYCTLMIPICATVTLINGNTLLPAGRDILLALAHGGIFIVAGTLLFNRGAKGVSAVAGAVLTQTEFICVPMMVLVVFGEKPSTAAFIGGAIILGAVILQAVSESRRQTDSLPTEFPG